MEEQKKTLAEMLLGIKAIRLQPDKPFTWASGWLSPIYCDNRKVNSYPEVRSYVKTQLASIISEKFSDVDGISGATTSREEPQDTARAKKTGKILIAYFSRAEENYHVGVINEGNTAKFAREIAAQTGGDLFEIVPTVPYPSGYNETLSIATEERNSGARPEIAKTVSNFQQYDTIFIGYPIWWGDLPMILHTFMESYDWSGKVVIPFCTHEGSGLSGTDSSIASVTGAQVLTAIDMRGSTAQNLNDAFNLLLASNNRVEEVLSRHKGEVGTKVVERRSLAFLLLLHADRDDIAFQSSRYRLEVFVVILIVRQSVVRRLLAVDLFVSDVEALQDVACLVVICFQNGK